MKFIVSENRHVLGQWAKDRIPECTGWGDFRAIGLISDKGIHAVAIFNQFHDNGCCIHIAADEFSKDFVHACFDYAYGQCGYERLTAMIASNNQKSLRLVKKLGFVKEGCIRKMLPDDDVLLFGLLKEECRYYGQVLSTRCA